MTTLPDDILKTIKLLRDGPFPPETRSQPAAEFEACFGLTDIACHHVLPDGITANELEAYARLQWADCASPEALDNLNRMLDVLKELNPALNALAYDNMHFMSVYHLVMGVASAYRVEDIRYFLSGEDLRARAMEATDEYKSLCDAFNAAAAGKDMNMQWAAAPSTLVKMRDQFLAKAKNNPPAAAS